MEGHTHGAMYHPHQDVASAIHAHDMHSRHAHHVTHEKLDDVREELKEDVEELQDELEAAIHKGRESYHPHHGVHKMYDGLTAGSGLGSLIGGGIGGSGGALFASLLRGGFGFDGHRGGGCGGECGCGRRGCGGECGCCGMETRIEDTIRDGNATDQRFMLVKDNGELKKEVATMALSLTNTIREVGSTLQLQACANNAAQLAATAQAKFDIVHNADQIAFKQLEIAFLKEREENARRHSDLQITMVQNSNQAQAQAQVQENKLLNLETRRHLDLLALNLNVIGNAVQSANAVTQNKSFTFGSGTSSATNTANTNNAS